MSTTKNQRVIIHACGGCGLTITKKEIEKLVNDPLLNVIVKYIDTSIADAVPLGIADEDFFLIKNDKVNQKTDGSGGLRATLDAIITPGVKEYLNQLEYAKTDIHVVISSASGGSGSLIAPRLIHSLKEVGAAAIYLTVTDTSSVQYCETTIETLTHIDQMGRIYGYSVPTIPVDNKDAINIVNKAVGTIMDLLAILFSAEHKSLDTTDMLYFGNNAYDKAATGMVSLAIYDENNIVKLKDDFISSLRILTTDQFFKVDTEVLTKIRQYKIGFISEEVKARLEQCAYTTPVFYAITQNSLVEKVSKIKSDLEIKLGIKEAKVEMFGKVDSIGGVKI